MNAPWTSRRPPSGLSEGKKAMSRVLAEPNVNGATHNIPRMMIPTARPPANMSRRSSVATGSSVPAPSFSIQSAAGSTDQGLAGGNNTASAGRPRTVAALQVLVNVMTPPMTGTNLAWGQGGAEEYRMKNIWDTFYDVSPSLEVVPRLARGGEPVAYSGQFEGVA
jgi:hypothetical protein